MLRPPSPGEHQHGGDPQRDLQRFGLSARSVVDFSANLSPLGPPAAVRELWPDLWREVESYPSLRGDGVASFYRDRFGIESARVLPGNGATELIYLLPRGLGFRRVAVPSPAYDDYQRASRLAGARVEPYLLRPEEGFAAPGYAALEEIAGRVDAVFVGHPNNPTGTLFGVQQLRELAAEFPRVWWIVDESFIQLTESFPAQSLAFGGPTLPANLLVVHSLTKVYALAGLRLGAVLGAPETITRLREAKEPWTVNGVADRVAQVLSQCEDYEERLRRLVHLERRRLAEGLAALGTVEVIPPTANFVLARWRPGSLDDLLRGLLERGICVRDGRNFPGLADNYFRLAVRKREDNLSLLTAFESLSGAGS